MTEIQRSRERLDEELGYRLHDVMQEHISNLEVNGLPMPKSLTIEVNFNRPKDPDPLARYELTISVAPLQGAANG